MIYDHYFENRFLIVKHPIIKVNGSVPKDIPGRIYKSEICNTLRFIYPSGSYGSNKT